MKELSIPTAVILAGGLGTRLRSLVADRPKVLAEVCGQPFMAHLLDQLSAAGLQRAVICTGYLGEQVRAKFGASYKALRLFYSREPVPLGTAGALRSAQPLFEADTVLVMNGDSFCDVDLRALMAWCHERGATGALVLTRVPDTRRYGRVHVDANELVTRFEEKSAGRGPGWINAGVYLLGESLLGSIPPNGAISLEQQMLPAWAAERFYGYRHVGRFLDIGTPEAYTSADEFFARQG